MSEPIGRKDIGSLIEKHDHVLILAAGTGITPMINIIEHRRRTKNERQKTILYWFNRREEDICEQLVEKDGSINFNFDYLHILSDASSDWKGQRGRIQAEILEKPNLDWSKTLVFVCGPIGFNNATLNILTKLKIPSDRVIVFQ